MLLLLRTVQFMTISSESLFVCIALDYAHKCGIHINSPVNLLVVGVSILTKQVGLPGLETALTVKTPINLIVST